MAAAGPLTCQWCGRGLPGRGPRGGAWDRRFCGDPCRHALHTAARRWALAMLDAGFLDVDTLRRAEPAGRSRVALGRRPKGSA